MRDDEERRKRRPTTRARSRQNKGGRRKAMEDQKGQTGRSVHSRVGSHEQQSEQKKRPTVQADRYLPKLDVEPTELQDGAQCPRCVQRVQHLQRPA